MIAPRPIWAELSPLYAIVNGKNKKLPNCPLLGTFPLFAYHVEIIQDESGRRIEAVKIERSDSYFGKFVEELNNVSRFMSSTSREIASEYEEAAKDLNIADAIILAVGNKTDNPLKYYY